MPRPPKRDRKKAGKASAAPQSHRDVAAGEATAGEATAGELSADRESSTAADALPMLQTSVPSSELAAGHEPSAKAEPRLQTSVPSAQRGTGHLRATDGDDRRLAIFTIGHSTHPLDEFVALLKNHGIEQLVDVRTVPKSRHVPQFNLESLSVELPKRGIEYVHMKSLGGLRHAKKDSINTGWRNASFRGYADYMASDEFKQGIEQLMELARNKPTVIMCAEAVPWRCHRSLIGDALLARGVQVEDIMSATSSRPHKLTEFAHVEGQRITYPGDSNLELFKQ